MSHNIHINEEGKASFCFTGSRDHIWHGLGAELPEGASIEVWKKAAGMDWEVNPSAVLYRSNNGTGRFPGRVVLYRNDTQFPLSIVSDEFKIVQPGEVLEFFRDLTETHGMTLSTAGCLFNGKQFWALANTGKMAPILKGDDVTGMLLLVTSVDGTLATTAKFVSERVVCHNTLTIALKDSDNRIVRKTHRSVWDATSAKIDLGLIDESWNQFVENLRKMSEFKMNDSEVRDFFMTTLFDPTKEEISNADQRKMGNLINLYQSGAGADMAYGSAWGVLNAVTNLATHGDGRKRKPGTLFQDSLMGSLDLVKNKVYDKLLELVD